MSGFRRMSFGSGDLVRIMEKSVSKGACFVWSILNVHGCRNVDSVEAYAKCLYELIANNVNNKFEAILATHDDKVCHIERRSHFQWSLIIFGVQMRITIKLRRLEFYFFICCVYCIAFSS